MFGNKNDKFEIFYPNIPVDPCSIADSIIRSHVIETGEIPSLITVQRSVYADMFLNGDLDCSQYIGEQYTYKGISIEASGPDVMIAYGKMIAVSEDARINTIDELMAFTGEKCNITHNLMRELLSLNIPSYVAPADVSDDIKEK